MIPTVSATRYVAPLREGGSLPGIVEADDLGTYVCKFRGASQGLRVLVAEVIVGELARRLGINTPDLVAIELDAAIGRYEADEEVQDLLTASVGLNLGVDFLPGSFGFDSGCTPDPEVAARVLWLDVLAAYLPGVAEADAALAPMVTRDLLCEVVAQVPDEWLEVPPGAESVAAVRGAYVDFLLARVSGERSWLPGVAAA